MSEKSGREQGSNLAAAVLNLDLAEKINEVEFADYGDEENSGEDDLMDMYNDLLEEDNQVLGGNLGRTHAI